MAVRRTLVLVAEHARSDGQAPLDDLAGAGGRFDVVCRFVTSALLTSHGLRTDTDAVVLFTADGRSPKALRVRGDAVRGLAPDERSATGLLNRALRPVALPVWQRTLPGIELRALAMTDLVKEADRPLVVLAEDGSDHLPPGSQAGTFVIGDHAGLSRAHVAELDAAADTRLRLGPVALQADQVAVVLHNRLDRLA